MKVNLMKWTAVGACGISLALAVVRTVVPSTASYATGFAPAWVTAVAALAGGLALFATKTRAVGWASVVLLVWSAGGVLFDLLRIAAVLGIPGLPPVVDWLGFLSRTAAATAAVSLAIVLRRHGRTNQNIRQRLWLGYLAVILACPYPMLKLYWAFGGTAFGSAIGTPEGFPVGEVIAFGAAAVLALALVHNWGSMLPRWLLIAGGCVSAGALISMGALVFFGLLSSALGLTNGPATLNGAGLLVALVYGSWLALGLALAAATRDFQARTRIAALAS